MKDIIKIGGKLAIICATAAIALGLVNAITEPVIEEVKKRRLEEALARVVKEGQVEEIRTVERDQIEGYYPVTDSEAEIIGYVVKLIGLGYGGDMHLLANYAPDGTLKDVVLMENKETPGLGKKAENPQYMEMFINAGGGREIPTRKDMLSREDADSVTGATITFMGIANALKAGSDFIMELERE